MPDARAHEGRRAGLLTLVHQPDHLLDIRNEGQVLDDLHLRGGVYPGRRNVLEHVPCLVLLDHLVEFALVDLVALVRGKHELVVHAGY